MTGKPLKGRRLHPIEAFEVTPWRALALFRLGTLVYAIALMARNVGGYDHPYLAWAVIGVMAIWSGLASAGYERAPLRAWPLLLVDVAVTAVCVLASAPVIGPSLHHGAPTLTVAWMACPALAVAVVKGIRWGVAAALLVGGCDMAVRGGISQATFSGTAILIMAAAAVGYLGNIATRAQEQLRQVAAIEAAHAERDRLARSIHDSVLQVLALVQRQGEQIGGRAAELGRLAGEQEVALRTLIAPTTAAGAVPAGMTDLRALVAPLASGRVTVSAPATAVWLPALKASEVFAAIVAATDNVHQHCPQETKVWILIEDEGDRVTATVRDDGPGIPDGRLEEAAAQGRLGVALSIRGRVAELGGAVAINTAPGQGTEVELTVTVAS